MKDGLYLTLDISCSQYLTSYSDCWECVFGSRKDSLRDSRKVDSREGTFWGIVREGTDRKVHARPCVLPPVHTSATSSQTCVQDRSANISANTNTRRNTNTNSPSWLQSTQLLFPVFILWRSDTCVQSKKSWTCRLVRWMVEYCFDTFDQWDISNPFQGKKEKYYADYGLDYWNNLLT